MLLRFNYIRNAPSELAVRCSPQLKITEVGPPTYYEVFRLRFFFFLPRLLCRNSRGFLHSPRLCKLILEKILLARAAVVWILMHGAWCVAPPS